MDPHAAVTEPRRHRGLAAASFAERGCRRPWGPRRLEADALNVCRVKSGPTDKLAEGWRGRKSSSHSLGFRGGGEVKMAE